MQGWVGVRAGSGQQSSSKGHGLAKASGQGGGLKVVLSTDPVRFPLTGIGRYTYELARGLQQVALSDLRFMNAGRLGQDLPRVPDAQPHSHGPWLRRVLQRQDWALRLHGHVQALRQSRAMSALPGHVFHSPNFYLPPTPGPAVVTLHDLSCYEWAHCHPVQRVRHMQREIAQALKRADVLITVSERMRQDIARFFSWPIDRLVATPLAAGPDFQPRSPTTLQTPLQALGLVPDGYALYVGTVEPRKNLSRLIQAYARLPEGLRQRWPLVLAGYVGWNSQHLHAQIQAAQSQGWLRYLGYVPQHRLPELMAGARLFVFPSLYEGFGLPVLEAMASGVPVVSSTASSLPEVCGDAALMHDPQDDEMLLAHLKKGLEDEVWREQARARGLVQAGRFSWARCTDQTLAAYRLAQELA